MKTSPITRGTAYEEPQNVSGSRGPWSGGPGVVGVVVAGLAWCKRGAFALGIVAVLLGVGGSALCGVLESFESYEVHSFPDRWTPASPEKARDIYRILEEHDNRFLRADAANAAVHLGLQHVTDPRAFRKLSWRWRVKELPRGGDERNVETHDAAAQVYVVFDGRFLPRVIKYVWSSTLPAGMRVANPLYFRGWVVVLRTGLTQAGRWVREQVNYYEDYKELFGGEPASVEGFGILTSSDSTGTKAVADYDDFRLQP